MPQRLIHVPLQQIAGILEEIRFALLGGENPPDVPLVEPSLGLIGQALLDRTFTILTSAFTAVPSAADVREAVAEATAARNLFEAEGWLDDPASYHESMGQLFDTFDVNEFAASVKVFAVKPL